MSKRKLFNDPVYGFISFPFDLIYDLIDHPYFQRLRRISQLGLTQYVYPGAIHTRFHHAIGALHLMTKAIDSLRLKGVDISEVEAEAVSIAILLHDIGHGPFSHALEGKIINAHHEELSIAFIEYLNQEFNGRLDLALQIFKNQYHKPFLFQLISGQLDMDRMDYLNRDSFFTGVAEGVIGYDRIIKMLNVRDGRLVVEEKGIYSIEKFLVARRIMYWQVYLHKTVLSTELMLILFMDQLKEKIQYLSDHSIPNSLLYFLIRDTEDQSPSITREALEKYSLIDDIDILQLFKHFSNSNDKLLKFLSKSLLNRRLFKIILRKNEIDGDFVNEIRHKVGVQYGLGPKEAQLLVLQGSESNTAYTVEENEIQMLLKSGEVVPMSSISDHLLSNEITKRHYLCFPKIDESHKIS